MNNLYKGPKFYEESDKDIFYGRDKETQKLYYLVGNSDFSVCYAKTGEGKSSLINAGLAPMLRKNDYLPIRIVLSDKKFNTDIKKGNLDDLVWDAIEQTVKKENGSAAKHYRDISYYPLSTSDNLAFETLGWKLRNIELRGDSFHKIIPVIIFDQFEEVFSKAKDISWTNSFFYWLENLYDDSAYNLTSENQQKKFKVLLSMRSDYISELDYWAMDKYFIPSLKNNRYCLKALTLNGTEEIINKLYINKIEGISTKEILEATKIEKAGCLASNDKSIPCISALALSLIITCIEEAKVGIQKIIKDFEKNKYTVNALFDKILEFYYSTSICECGITKQEQEVLETALVDIKGYRKRVSMVNSNISKIKEHKLKQLENKRIIHISNNSIELSHDCLKHIITNNNQKRLSKIENRLFYFWSLFVYVFSFIGCCCSVIYLLGSAVVHQDDFIGNLNTFLGLFNHYDMIAVTSFSICLLYLPYLLFYRFTNGLMLKKSINIYAVFMIFTAFLTFFCLNYNYLSTWLGVSVFSAKLLGVTFIAILIVYIVSLYTPKIRLTTSSLPFKNSKNSFKNWLSLTHTKISVAVFFVILAMTIQNTRTPRFGEVWMLICGFLSISHIFIVNTIVKKNWQRAVFYITNTCFIYYIHLSLSDESIPGTNYTNIGIGLIISLFIVICSNKESIIQKCMQYITNVCIIFIFILIITGLSPSLYFGGYKLVAIGNGKNYIIEKNDKEYICTNEDRIIDNVSFDKKQIVKTTDSLDNLSCVYRYKINNSKKGIVLDDDIVLLPIRVKNSHIDIYRHPDFFGRLDSIRAKSNKKEEILAASTMFDFIQTISNNSEISTESILHIDSLYIYIGDSLKSYKQIAEFKDIVRLEQLMTYYIYIAIIKDAIKDNRKTDIINVLSLLNYSFFGNTKIYNYKISLNINEKINYGNNNIVYSEPLCLYSDLLRSPNLTDNDKFWFNNFRASLALSQKCINEKHNFIIEKINSADYSLKESLATVKDLDFDQTIEKYLSISKKYTQGTNTLMNSMLIGYDMYMTRAIQVCTEKIAEMIEKDFQQGKYDWRSILEYRFFLNLCNVYPIDKIILNNREKIHDQDKNLMNKFKSDLTESLNRMQKQQKEIDNTLKSIEDKCQKYIKVKNTMLKWIKSKESKK